MDLKSVVPMSIGGSRRWRSLVMLSTGAGIVAALVVSLVSLAFAVSPNFPDVAASHPYYTAISYLAARDIIGGYPDGAFRPDNPVTRQQFAKMAVLTGGYPVSEGNVCPFADVTIGGAGTFYPDNFIAVCAAKGITTGKTATTFAPGDNITRLQVISMVVRMAGNLQPGLLAAVPEGLALRVGWATDATHGANAAQAEYNGLLAGLNLSALSPTGNMSRGEVAQVLYNLLGKLTVATTTTAPSITTTTTALADYEKLGGMLTSAPAACSWGEGRLDVFARGVEGNLWHKWYGPGGWSAWTNLGGFVKAGTDPAAVAWSDAAGGHFDVFVIGPNDHIWHKGWTGIAWSDWKELTCTTTPASSPAAATTSPWWGPDRPHLLFAAADGSVQWLNYGSSSYFPISQIPQQSLGGSVQTGSSPAAVSVDSSGTLQVFIRGTNDALWHRQESVDASWSEWTNLGGLLTSSPAACACDGRSEVFVRGPDNGLWQKTYTSSWSDWKSLESGAVASSPTATSWGPDRIDVFVRGTDDQLWHKWWDGSTWRP
jgi:hypothetical protein